METKSIFRLVTAKTTLKTGKKEQSNVFVIEINTYFFSVILHSWFSKTQKTTKGFETIFEYVCDGSKNP